MMEYPRFSSLHDRSRNGPKLVTNEDNAVWDCLSDFAEHLEDSKSTSGGTLCVFGSHAFVPQVGCVRNKLHFRISFEIGRDSRFVGSDCFGIGNTIHPVEPVTKIMG